MSSYHELLNEVMLLTGERYKTFEFPHIAKGFSVSQHLPIVRQMFETSKEMHKLPVGNQINVTGYLEPFSVKSGLSKPVKMGDRFGIKIKGCKACRFFAEPSKIPTEIIVFSDKFEKSVMQLPYQLDMLKIGEYDGRSFFYLKDYSVSILKPEKFDFKPLRLKDMISSLSEVAFLGKKEEHVAHAILSGFIGSDFVANTADGVGSSYIYNPQVESDLINMKNAINSTRYGIPLSHFGVWNMLSGDITNIESKRSEAYLKLRSISFNVPSTRKNLTNIRLSEFKYDIPNLLFKSDLRDIENNFDFLQSLIFYALKNKAVHRPIYDISVLTAHREIKQYVDRINREKVFEIVDSERLDEQIGRIVSYLSAFDTDEKKINKAVKDAVVQNIESVIEKVSIESIKPRNIPVHMTVAYALEKSMPSGVRIAYYVSNKTEQGFIEKICEILGYDEKRATDIFSSLLQGGLIFQENDGRYKWVGENRFRLV